MPYIFINNNHMYAFMCFYYQMYSFPFLHDLPSVQIFLFCFVFVVFGFFGGVGVVGGWGKGGCWGYFLTFTNNDASI